MTATSSDLDVTVTSVVETRVVEADLGPFYARGSLYRISAFTGAGICYHLVPHRVRVLYRRPRPDVDRRASADWVVTQVIVIGRAELALTRHQLDGDPLPPERQRTYVDLDAAPRWIGDVAVALAHEEVT